jgi:hypothetical protein
MMLENLYLDGYIRNLYNVELRMFIFCGYPYWYGYRDNSYSSDRRDYVCLGFFQLLITKRCCGLPNAELFSRLL